MSQQQVQKQKQTDVQDSTSEETVADVTNQELTDSTEDVLASIDDVLEDQDDEDILAEMDEVLEENAQEFVEGFVQQGGQ